MLSCGEVKRHLKVGRVIFHLKTWGHVQTALPFTLQSSHDYLSKAKAAKHRFIGRRTLSCCDALRFSRADSAIISPFVDVSAPCVVVTAATAASDNDVLLSSRSCERSVASYRAPSRCTAVPTRHSK